MRAREDRVRRLGRGALVGAFATGTAALSHAIAGGATPSPLALVVGLVAGTLLASVALPRATFPRLAAAVVLVQLPFHALFAALGTSAGYVAGHLHSVSIAIVGHVHDDGPAMWIAHAIAAALTIAFLRFGERALRRMLHRLIARVTALPHPIALAAEAVPARPGPLAVLAAAPLRHVIARRGPPVLPFA